MVSFYCFQINLSLLCLRCDCLGRSVVCHSDRKMKLKVKNVSHEPRLVIAMTTVSTQKVSFSAQRLCWDVLTWMCVHVATGLSKKTLITGLSSNECFKEVGSALCCQWPIGLLQAEGLKGLSVNVIDWVWPACLSVCLSTLYCFILGFYSMYYCFLIIENFLLHIKWLEHEASMFILCSFFVSKLFISCVFLQPF